jgi:hypothetical protein
MIGKPGAPFGLFSKLISAEWKNAKGRACSGGGKNRLFQKGEE